MRVTPFGMTRREWLRACQLGAVILAGRRVGAQSVTVGGAQAPPQEPAVTGYICPMHPNEVRATPGTCSICGMTLVPGDPMATADFRVEVATEPRLVRAGQNTKFRLTVRHPLTGARVTSFADVHDRLFHLFVVSRDLTQFFHIHPEQQSDGSFVVDQVLPQAGHYVLYCDFMPLGAGPQVIASPLVTAGFDGDITSAMPHLTPDATLTKTVDGVDVVFQIERSKVVAGEDIDVPVHFVDAATGAPVRDLQRYLGAFGHAMMLSEDMMEYVHAHPAEMLEGTLVTSGGGPDLVFHALFPKPGHYRIWLQFQRRDRLSTVPFTIKALRPGETA